MIKQKILNFPNILTILRFLMVPFVFYVIFSNLPHHQLLAGGVVVLAYITDVLDGYIARHNNQVTDFGKIMDPAADKFMQIALFVCLSIQNPIIIPAFLFLLIKDLCLGIGATILYKKGVVMSANWYGKTASFVTLFSLLAILVLNLPQNFMLILVYITVVFNLIAIIAYISTYSDTMKKIGTNKE